MKRKWTYVVLVLVMVFTSLTGCSEKVTAESLIDNAFKDVENMELEMSMELEMEVSASDMTVDVALDMVGDIETSKKASHVDMDVTMNLMGMEMSESTETYAIVDGDTLITYTYDADYDQWYYVESEYQDKSAELSSDLFENLEMEETDDGYKVTGVVKDINELMTGMSGDATTEAVVDALKDIDVVATLIFNEDKAIEEMIILFEVDEEDVIDIDGMGQAKISNMELAVEFKNLTGDEVELPVEVEENAISEDEYLGVGDDYDEDDVDETESVETGYEMVPMGGIAGTNPPSIDKIYFSFKDADYTLDTLTIEALKEIGYKVEDDRYVDGSEYSVEPGDYIDVDLSDDNICYVTIYYRNHSEEAMDVLACDVVGFYVNQSYEMQWESGAHCNFSILGIPAGTSEKDVENLLGTPDDYYVFEDTISYYYYFDKNRDAAVELQFTYGYGLTGFNVNTGLFN